MLELLAAQFYTHDKTEGFIVVVIVCGAMILFAAWVAYTNFGPSGRAEYESSLEAQDRAGDPPE